MATRVFIAYSSTVESVGHSIEAAVAQLRSVRSLDVETWRQMDVAGRFIVEGVDKKILEADVVIADITAANFNVIYEFGYAMGRGRQPVPIINSGYFEETTKKLYDRLGVFDSVGMKTYQNASELAELIKAAAANEETDYREVDVNRRAPLYLLESQYKTDGLLRLVARIKKARIRYRTFDPTEQARLSALHAQNQVQQSVGVVVPLFGRHARDHELSNLRGAFLIGLARAQNKALLILQEGEGPVPADYRDLVKFYKNPGEIDRYFNDFAPEVTQGLQEITGQARRQDSGVLDSLDLGASSAENEIADLGSYYVATDEFRKVSRGVVRLVAGRKGSGKTALFYQVRDRVKRDRANVVLDLKPEGFQLKRFKEILERFTESVQEHIAVAFWEHAILYELAYKLLRMDRVRHTRDHTLLQPYGSLLDAFGGASAFAEAAESDFSQRMLSLTRDVSGKLLDAIDTSSSAPAYLESPKVTELIYGEAIPQLRREIGAYLEHKEQVWILFDNIDKGWPTQGITPPDILILRTLIDATRKLERSLSTRGFDAHTVVFVRNDVYELLVTQSPDRGKERRVSLDWTDRDLLVEMLRRRLVRSSTFGEDEPFESVWHAVARSHVLGESSIDYVVERSLLRPRNLLNLVSQCVANAINLRHTTVSESDILKAAGTYSADLAKDLSMELRDVLPQAEDVLYAFIGSAPRLTLREIKELVDAYTDLEGHAVERLVAFLLWFAFIGVVSVTDPASTVRYIYDVGYDMKKLRFFAGALRDDEALFEIHVAFRPFLEVDSP